MVRHLHRGADATIDAYAICIAKTFQKTGAAMFVTTTTSACSFASNLASKIPALRIFGLSIAICVTLNFVFVLTIFPAAISMQRSWRRLLKPAFDKAKAKSMQVGTAAVNRLAARIPATKTGGRIRMVSSMVINTGSSVKKGVYDRYNMFHFWDWLAGGGEVVRLKPSRQVESA